MESAVLSSWVSGTQFSICPRWRDHIPNMRPHVTVVQQQYAKSGRYDFVVKELPALVEARWSTRADYRFNCWFILILLCISTNMQPLCHVRYGRGFFVINSISRVFFPNTFPTHFVCSAQCAALHFHFLQANLPVTDKRAISGHSMGGHGALTIGLKNPERQPGQTCTHTHTQEILNPAFGLFWKNVRGRLTAARDTDSVHGCGFACWGIALSRPLHPSAIPRRSLGDRRLSSSTSVATSRCNAGIATGFSIALEGNSPIVPNSDSLGLLTPKADGRRRVHGCPWAVSRWCLNAVSVVSRFSLGGVSLMSRWCLACILVVSSWCLRGVSLVSCWCLGCLLVVSPWCLGCLLLVSPLSSRVSVVSRWCLIAVSLFSWWCLPDVSVVSRLHLGRVFVVSRWCLAGVSVVSCWCLPCLLVSRWCLGGVSLLSRFSLGGVSLMSRWCLACILVVSSWCLAGVLVMSRLCFAGVSLVFCWCLDGVSVVSWLRLGGSGLLVLVVPLWCLNGVDGPYI